MYVHNIIVNTMEIGGSTITYIHVGCLPGAPGKVICYIKEFS